MVGGSILIVDDSPVNTKLVSLLLAHAGYQVRTVADAEAALKILKSYKPELVLADIHLPGMDGLEMTRRIKQDRRTSDVDVIALTASSAEECEAQALSAGCDGYIAKPIDAKTLPGNIREFLDRRRKRLQHPPADLAALGIAGPEFEALRRDFMQEGLAQCQRLLVSLDGQFDPSPIAKQVHQWAGDGGILEYPEISRLASEIDEAIRQKTYDHSLLRELLTDLVLAFADGDADVSVAKERHVPDHIQEALSDKRVALIGLPEDQAGSMCEVLERARARPYLFDLAESPDSAAVRKCDLVVLYVSEATKETAWLGPQTEHFLTRNRVLVGNPDQLLWLDPFAHALASEYVLDTWQPHELLLRMSFVLARIKLEKEELPVTSPTVAPETPALDDRPIISASPKILVAEDDPIIEHVVRTTLENHGMTCLMVRDGQEALCLAQKEHPQAAVLDVNMPGKDGYEVLEAIRAWNLPIAVVLLTARHLEKDIIRGFRLGADDYITKPFSPVELVARLRRLLPR